MTLDLRFVRNLILVSSLTFSIVFASIVIFKCQIISRTKSDLGITYFHLSSSKKMLKYTYNSFWFNIEQIYLMSDQSRDFAVLTEHSPLRRFKTATVTQFSRDYDMERGSGRRNAFNAQPLITYYVNEIAPREHRDSWIATDKISEKSSISRSSLPERKRYSRLSSSHVTEFSSRYTFFIYVNIKGKIKFDLTNSSLTQYWHVDSFWLTDDQKLTLLN